MKRHGDEGGKGALERIRALATDAAADAGVALYDVELKPTRAGQTLFVFIQKAGGVGVEDCRRVSRHLDESLDAEDLISSKYFLEVSSPGLERALRNPVHFLSALGETVKITWVTQTGEKAHCRGTLAEAGETALKVRSGDQLIPIPVKDVCKAHTVLDTTGLFAKDRKSKNNKQASPENQKEHS